MLAKDLAKDHVTCDDESDGFDEITAKTPGDLTTTLQHRRLHSLYLRESY